MTLEEILGNLGITQDQAKAVILEKLEQSEIGWIFQNSLTYNITNQMIADLLQTELASVTALGVSDFFTSHGYNGSALNGGTTTITTGWYSGSFQGALEGLFGFGVETDGSVQGEWATYDYSIQGEFEGSVDNNGKLYFNTPGATLEGEIVNDLGTGTWEAGSLSGQWSADFYA